MRGCLSLWLVLQIGCSDEPEAAPYAHGGSSDAGSEDAQTWVPPSLMLPSLDSPEVVRLSQLGLYEDLTTKCIAPDLIAYEPRYPLWSDGTDKRRWLRLPPGQVIDSADMDHWQFPVGTVFFKEFSSGGKLLETRVLARIGPTANDTWMGAFVWQDDEADAVLAREGVTDVRATGHDVPSQKNCFTCHNGEAGRVIGFSALQQPDTPAPLLSIAPATSFVVAGDAITAGALGYLHANCGHCHNPSGSARPDTDMNLRLSVFDGDAAATAIYRSTVGVALQYFANTPLRQRVVAGDPDQSALLFRMSERGPKTQMPPLASELVDPRGVALVRAWIAALPP